MIHPIQDQWENQEQDGRTYPGGHLTDLRNIRMVETSRGQRSMEASSEGGHVPKGAVAP
jgi:hypothetical protein